MLRSLKLKARTSAQRKRFNYLAETVYAFKNYTIPRLHQEYVLSGGAGGFNIYEDPVNDEDTSAAPADADTVDADTVDADTVDADTVDADTVDADPVYADTEQIREEADRYARDLIKYHEKIKNVFASNDYEILKNNFFVRLRNYIEAALITEEVLEEEDIEEFIEGQLDAIKEETRLLEEQSKALRFGMR